VPHSPLKCYNMWKELDGAYHVVHGHYTTSGQHNPDFFCYVQGNLPVYYLHCWLQIRPNMKSFVGAGMNEEDGMDTSNPAELKQKLQEKQVVFRKNAGRKSKRHFKKEERHGRR